MTTLIIAAVFLWGFFFILGGYMWLTSGKKNMHNRLETYTSKNLMNIIEKDQKEHAKLTPKEALIRISSIFKSKGIAQRLEVELSQADIPIKGEEFITTMILTALGPAVLVMLITENILLSFLLSILGIIGPLSFIKSSKSKRVALFNHQLSDALIMMSNSLRAGFSFLQAMEHIGNELPDPLSKEFKRVLREINLGTTTEEALVNLGKRVKSEDLDMVITAVLIQRQVGGNLAEVLDNISHTVRERVRIKGEVKTLTAQGRISGLIIGVLPVVLVGVLLVINPSYVMVLFNHQIGLLMLAYGIVSEIIGILLIQKVVNIKI
ncbi:tight adherence protein B [Desulfitispora alkaliphila]|uniref:type II secretion system F family protein n=1 Tax=Desulfitispora alkaliphila TaxID=622674 RepID=UPI003D259386